eukprot:1173581-Prorocentrum_minimum.AAC.1
MSTIHHGTPRANTARACAQRPRAFYASGRPLTGCRCLNQRLASLRPSDMRSAHGSSSFGNFPKTGLSM